jgi:hypothetical protein
MERQHITKERIENFFRAAQLTTGERIHIIEQLGSRLLLSSTLCELVPDLYSDVIRTPEGRSDKIRLFKEILDTRRADRVAEQLLTHAALSDTEACDFFHTYNRSFSFCYHAPTARTLYRRLLPRYSEMKCYLVRSWLPQRDMTPGEVDELLGATEAYLTREETIDILHAHGERLLHSNLHSAVLYNQVKIYLQNPPQEAFQTGSAAQMFLSFLMTISPYLPADIQEQLEPWSTIWAFLHHPSCHQSRVFAIARIIQGQLLPIHVLQSLLEPLGKAFASCIENAFQFCFVITTIMAIGEADTTELVRYMVNQIRSKLTARNLLHEQWQQRASEYLHFAFSPDAYDLIPSIVWDESIELLLYDADSAFLAFVDHQAQDWSPNIHAQWDAIKSRYGYQPVQARNRTIAQAMPNPEARRSGFIIAWLRFPAIDQQLRRIMTERGIGRRAAFWSANSDILLSLTWLLDHQWLREIEFACKLYDLMQLADTTMQVDDDQAIIQLVDDPNNNYHENKYSTHERVRLLVARGRADGSFPTISPAITPPMQGTHIPASQASIVQGMATASPNQQPLTQAERRQSAREQPSPLVLPDNRSLARDRNKYASADPAFGHKMHHKQSRPNAKARQQRANDQERSQ